MKLEGREEKGRNMRSLIASSSYHPAATQRGRVFALCGCDSTIRGFKSKYHSIHLPLLEKYLTISSPSLPAEAGFWPVKMVPSTSTCG